jgi:uncharacterized protein YndB with AHSA1/START domain
MTPEDCQPVSVSRRIAAPAERLFAVLANPARHPSIDGSGMVKQALTPSPISRAGDAFTMSMHNDEMGDYEITNHVVDYQPNRRIAWEPVLTAASREEDQADIGDRSRHRWIYDLTPDGPDATIVTETYDCTQAPEWLRRAVKNGQRWVTSMTVTLERLDQQCSRRLSSPGSQ